MQEVISKERGIAIRYYTGDTQTTRKQLFNLALENSQKGKVLYILCNELNELPELSQDIQVVNKHYLKMISFMYAKNLPALVENIATLPEWSHIPSTVMIDSLEDYCSTTDIQNACGIMALLLDTASAISKRANISLSLHVSVDIEKVGEQFFSTLSDLY